MATSPTPGTQIGQYEIVAQLGTGGMATVYKAHHNRLERDVAIKMMHSMFLTDSNFVARFEREARVVARLDHPNIVPVYDYDLYNNQPYLVMKLIEGKTLKEVMNRGAMPMAEVEYIITSVGSALHYAHLQGVLHRDIKPSNIILDNNGIPYLMDFGLARIAKAGESTMSADMLLGTPYYISPEQAQGGQELDARTDVYSLGVVLYEMVAGRLPFVGDTPYVIVHKHIYETPTVPSQLNPQISSSIEYVLLKALAKDRGERYATPLELAQAFRDAIVESGVTPRSVTPQALTKPSPSVVTPSLQPSDQTAEPVPPADAFKPSVVSGLPKPPVPPPPPFLAGNENLQQALSQPFKPGKVISIPSPVDSNANSTQTNVVPIPSLFSQEAFQEMLQRFREAIIDIRYQLMNGDTVRQARSGAERAFVEIKTHVEKAVEDSNGDFTISLGGELIESKGSKAKKAVKSSDSGAKRNNKHIQRDWGADEQSIRRRAKERVARQRGFFTHVFFYITFSAVFIATNPAIRQLVQGITSDEPDLAPLTQLNFALIIVLLWTGGVISHGLSVFYNSGRRLERRRQRIDEAMTRRYGEQWTEVATDREYKKVRSMVNKRFEGIVGFYQHVVNALFIVGVSIASWEPIKAVLANVLPMDEGWAQAVQQANMPLLFSLIMMLTIALHGITIFFGQFMGEDIHEQAIERELERERALLDSRTSRKLKNEDKTKRDTPRVRLTEDGEFTESMVETLDNLDDDPRQQRR